MLVNPHVFVLGFLFFVQNTTNIKRFPISLKSSEWGAVLAPFAGANDQRRGHQPRIAQSRSETKAMGTPIAHIPRVTQDYEQQLTSQAMADIERIFVLLAATPGSEKIVDDVARLLSQRQTPQG